MLQVFVFIAHMFDKFVLMGLKNILLIWRHKDINPSKNNYKIEYDTHYSLSRGIIWNIFHSIAVLPTNFFLLTSGSKWMSPDNKFVWCPSMTYLPSDANYSRPLGGPPHRFLLAIEVFNGFLIHHDFEPWESFFRVACEEPWTESCGFFL